jgi:glycosyltransferase involved in cell wall biosynthesis
MISEKKKIRVAIVENNFLVGGVQRLVLDQLSALDRETFEVLLVTLDQSERDNFYDRLTDDTTVEKLHFNSILDFRGWWKLYVVLKDFRPDVVKSSAYFSNTIVRFLKIILRYKVIVAEHNTKAIKSTFQKFVTRFLSRLSYATVVDSKLVAEYLSKSERIPMNKFRVIYNGADIDTIEAARELYGPRRSELRNEYGVTDNSTLFLHIARYVRQKNHIRLVEAFALLHAERSDCVLMLIGDGATKAEVTQRIDELGIKGSVIMIGARTDIYQFYVMSDFSVLSSDDEGFSITGIEGLACGAPLISTKVAGVVEYVEDGRNGFLSEMNTADFASKLQCAAKLSPDECAAMSKEAKETGRQYSVEKYKCRFRELVFECVQR